MCVLHSQRRGGRGERKGVCISHYISTFHGENNVKLTQCCKINTVTNVKLTVIVEKLTQLLYAFEWFQS